MSSFVRQKLSIFLLLGFLFISAGFASGADFEHKLKALYITRLADFIIWPDQIEENTFKICIDPNDKVAKQLKIIDIQSINDRQVEIIAPPADASIAHCDFLYLSQGQTYQSLASKPVFTLSSQPGFAEQGGMIEFYIENDKVRMKANLQAIDHAGIKLSSKLIRLLLIVTPGEAIDE